MNDLQIPPHSIDAERSVLGCILLDNNAFDNVHDLLPDHFYANEHKVIFRAMSEMLNDRKKIDVVTLAEHLQTSGKIGETQGIAYFVELISNTPTAVTIKRYAEIVREKALLRSLLEAIFTIQGDIYEAGEVSKKVERAQTVIMSLTERMQSSDPQFVGDLLDSRLEHYDSVMMGKVESIGTGFKDLDSKTGGGFEGGQLVIVAARPAMGKTSFAVQLAEQMQHKDGAGLIFTCEMPNAQIVDRIVSSQARLSNDTLRRGSFDDDGLNRLMVGSQKVKKMNLLVDDKAYTINSISSKARSVKRKHGLSVIVVDYIQLLEGVGETREQQVSSISRGLKKLAQELNVPVIALSQLNRGLEARQNKRPMMSDLRESGAIEQDADVILFIYRDEVYNPDSQDKGMAEIIIGKQRNGPTGILRLTFLSEYTRFEDFTGTYVERDEKPVKRRGFEIA